MTFAPRIVYGDLDLTDAPFAVEFGFDLGHGVTLYDVADSLMTDGSLAFSPSAGNREGLVIPVLIEWADSQQAAEFAALLDAEASKGVNTLTFYPGDGYGAATVLDTFVAQSVHDWDQDAEQAGLRRYLLTIPALPFGRSVDQVSFTWTGPGAELSPLSSLTGWTTVSGTTPTVIANPDGAGSAFQFTGTVTLESPSVALDEYLWVKWSDSSLSGISIGGVATDTAKWRDQLVGGRRFLTIPTGDFAGTSAKVRFVGMTGTLYEFYTVSYPSPVQAAADLKPRGIGVVDVAGSARTTCRISFTAPAGGAFVYTAPDPNVSIRERGAGEVVFGHFEVSSANGAEVNAAGQVMWFPQGTHSAQVGLSSPQPLELNPNGVWPSQFSGQATWDGGSTGIATGAYQFAYPADAKAAISFFNTTGAKNLISPSPALPEGYHGGAVHHEVHALHPGRCGFAVLDQNGDPISATVTYYPRWWSHAAQ